MKKGIHPDYMECNVKCSCGESFVIQSNKPELRVETCDKCHPFYTGEQKLGSTDGRVDRFNKKYGIK